MMNFTDTKSKMKKKKKIIVSGIVAGVAFLVTASTVSAAIVWTAVEASIMTAVTDYGAGAVIILGAFAGIWGIRQVINLYRGHKWNSFLAENDLDYTEYRDSDYDF